MKSSQSQSIDAHVREESPADCAAIEDLTIAAFLDAAHSDHTEQYILRGLRHSGQLSLSLVAEVQGAIVGHLAASPVQISDGANDWFGLGPVSVTPLQQGKGIGSRLIYAALDSLKSRSASGCVLLGDPNYYSRFGFVAEPALVYPGVPAEYFQAILFQGEMPEGIVTYHDSFELKS